jgi:hypothetical protein
MSKTLTRWLTSATLADLGGTYHGVIATVRLETVHNRKLARDDQEPVIRFQDGWCLVPNQTMRVALIAALGDDTDTWTGATIGIVRHRVEAGDQRPGEAVGQYVRRLVLPQTEGR